ncbi:unnamed protein product [Adineta ricciae]|uniref:Uncharacterized protein n=1 Tax=Adineta ricciae TaxID=249248 RepID=A0A814L764_ADIRI|nr:unnamed protein product [Adineta ricciae]
MERQDYEENYRDNDQALDDEDNHELSVTPVPEIINDEDNYDENIDPVDMSKSQDMPSLSANNTSSTTMTGAKSRRKHHHHHHHHHRHPQRHVDENVPQQQQQSSSTSSVTVTTPDDNGPLSATTTAITTKSDDRASPVNHHTLRENQQLSDRSSPVNGPGLAKPISMTSSLKEHRSSATANTAGTKRIDAALEKNIETIVTQVRRTTTKPSQLTQNDLQLFDSTSSTNSIPSGHHSRETTPITSTSNQKHVSSSSSREMTPDSINADSANEDQQQQQQHHHTIRNGNHYYHQRAAHPQSPTLPPGAATADLNAPTISPYGQQPWPPTVYPFPHQHPGLYLPYPPPTTSTPANGLPSFYPSYDPLLIEQHYGSQGLSAFYTQQQQQQARLLQEHSTMSDRLSTSLTTPTREHGENSPVGSGESTKSADSIATGHRKKKSASRSSQPHPSANENISKLSPDHSSDGAGTNDADSIISVESQKSGTNSSMPILEDGLSDSENLSGDEQQQSSPVKSKTNGCHQATKSDFLFDKNHSSLVTSSHKRQFAKSVNTNGVEPQSNSFYIRPPPPSSFVRPVVTNHSTPPGNTPTSDSNRTKIPPEETSTAPADEGNTNPKPVRKKDYDTDEETDKLLGVEHRINAKNQAIRDAAVSKPTSKSKSQETLTQSIAHPENSSVLIEGVLFRCRYLGSTQLLVEGNPTKASRMMQAQEAVGRIKAPQGESQPSVEVDLFISTEKIMVLNTDLQDILMDHSLRSISYIADIGDLVVLMAKRRYLQHTDDSVNGSDDSNETATRRVVSVNQKMICHVFESEEAQPIAHSIGQAFQVAYVEFLKANGIDDPSLTRDIDYQEVLNQQEIGSEELDRFSKKECQKEVIVPKAKNEPLGIVIVESGWGSMLPTVVIANMMPTGPAARGGHLNIGDQIISVNGISLVGLPLSSCQAQIKSVKHLTTVRLVVVPCPPVVEVLIRRPDTKYQLGFSVQNGIICSLLRGGIAERGGVRVGHRIIEINGNSVVATPHERIVSMLSNSIGELRMKTMPTQMYRLLTGQENPIYI